MKKLLIKSTGIFFLLVLCFSCSDDDGLTQKQEADNLEQMFSEIESMAFSVDCNDSSEWTFTSYGDKACGGPVDYIAYSTNIDTALFLQKIEEHRIAQQKFNKKWGIISDCSLIVEPSGVICEDRNPVFEY